MTVLTFAHASHFRYGKLAWKHIGTTITDYTVEFTATLAWRRSFYVPEPDVGDSIDQRGAFEHDDGTNEDVNGYTVITQNNDEDFVIAQRSWSHTYSAPNKAGEPYRVSFQDTSRLNDPRMGNGNNGAWDVFAFVDLDTYGRDFVNNCPSSTQIPIQLVGSDRIVQWFLPTADKDNDPITFRLALGSEIGGIDLYPHVSVDNETGLITFDGRPSAVNNLHPVGIVISDPFCSTMVDFLVEIIEPQRYCNGCSGGDNCYACAADVDCGSGGPSLCLTDGAVCVENAAPNITSTVVATQDLPACAEAGQSFTFEVIAEDNVDVCNDMSIRHSEFPDGATFTQVGSVGNPLVMQFAWSPTVNQPGLYTFAFQARDDADALSENLIVTVFVPETSSLHAPPITSVAPLSFWADDPAPSVSVTGSGFQQGFNLRCATQLDESPSDAVVFTRPAVSNESFIECPVPSFADLSTAAGGSAVPTANFSVSNIASCGDFTFFEDAPFVFYPRDLLSVQVTADPATVSLRPAVLQYNVTITHRTEEPSSDMQAADVLFTDASLATGDYSLLGVTVDGSAGAGADAIAAGVVSGNVGAVFQLNNITQRVTNVIVFVQFSSDPSAVAGEALQLPSLAGENGFDVRPPFAEADAGFVQNLGVSLVPQFGGANVVWVQDNTIQPGALEMTSTAGLPVTGAAVPGDTVQLSSRVSLPFTGTIEGARLELQLTTAGGSNASSVLRIRSLTLAASGGAEASPGVGDAFVALAAADVSGALTLHDDKVVLDLNALRNVGQTTGVFDVFVTADVPDAAMPGSEVLASGQWTWDRAGAEQAAAFDPTSIRIVSPVAGQVTSDIAPVLPAADAGDYFGFTTTLTAGSSANDSAMHRVSVLDAGLAAGLYRVVNVTVDGVLSFSADVVNDSTAGLASGGRGPGGAGNVPLVASVPQITPNTSVRVEYWVQLFNTVEAAASVPLSLSGEWWSHPLAGQGVQYSSAPVVSTVPVSVPELSVYEVSVDTSTASGSAPGVPRGVFVGSIVQAGAAVVVPEGTTSASLLSVSLSGVVSVPSAVRITGVSVSGSAAVSSSVGGWTAVSSGAVVAGDGQSASVSLGSLLNVDEDNAVSESVVVQVTLEVPDSPGLVGGDVVSVSAGFTSSGVSAPGGGTGGVPLSAGGYAVQVRLASLEVVSGPVWSPASSASVDGGDDVSVSFVLGHGAAGNASAFNVSTALGGLTSSDWSVVSGEVDGVAVGAGVLASLHALGEVQLVDELPLGVNVSGLFVLRVRGGVEAGRALPSVSLDVSQSSVRDNSPDARVQTITGALQNYTVSDGAAQLQLASDGAVADAPVVSVGSVVTLTTVVTVPEGTAPGSVLRLSYDGGDGVHLVPGSVSLVPSSGAVSSDVSGSWGGIASATESAWGMSGADAVLGTVSNTDRDNTVTENITVTVQVRVVNGSSPWASGGAIEFAAEFDSQQSCGSCTRSTAVLDVQLPGDVIVTQVDLQPVTVLPGDVFAVTLEVANDAAAPVSAAGLLLRDAGLPDGLYTFETLVVNSTIVQGARAGADGVIGVLVGADTQVAPLLLQPGQRANVTVLFRLSDGVDLQSVPTVQLFASVGSHPDVATAVLVPAVTNQAQSPAVAVSDVTAQVQPVTPVTSIAYELQWDAAIQPPRGLSSQLNVSFRLAADGSSAGLAAQLNVSDILQLPQLIGATLHDGITVDGANTIPPAVLAAAIVSADGSTLLLQLSNVAFNASCSGCNDSVLELQLGTKVLNSPVAVDRVILGGAVTISSPRSDDTVALGPVAIREPQLAPSVLAVGPDGFDGEVVAGSAVEYGLTLVHGGTSVVPAFNFTVLDAALGLTRALAAGDAALGVLPAEQRLFMEVVFASVSPHATLSSAVAAPLDVPLGGAQLNFTLGVLPATEAGVQVPHGQRWTLQYTSHPTDPEARVYTAPFVLQDAGTPDITVAAPAAAGTAVAVDGVADAGAVSKATIGSNVQWTAILTLPAASVSNFSLKFNASGVALFTSPLQVAVSASGAEAGPWLAANADTAAVDAAAGSVEVVEGGVNAAALGALATADTASASVGGAYLRPGTAAGFVLPAGGLQELARGTVQLNITITGTVTDIESAVAGAQVAPVLVAGFGASVPVTTVTFPPLRIVEPVLAPPRWTPLAVSEQQAGSRVSFNTTLQHATSSTADAGGVVLSDASLVWGALQYETPDGTLATDSQPTARAYDLVRVVGGDVVVFDADTGVDTLSLGGGVAGTGVLFMADSLPLGQQLPVQVTVQMWSMVPTHAVLHSNFSVAWASPGSAPAVRAYAKDSTTSPAIGLQAPAVDAEALTDRATRDNDQLAVGGTWNTQIEVALPQGLTRDAELVLSVRAQLPPGSALLPGQDVLANFKLDSITTLNGETAPWLTVSGSCAGGAPSSLSDVAALTVVDSAADGNATVFNVSIPLCDMTNSGAGTAEEHVIRFTVSGVLNGGAVYAAAPLQGASVTGVAALVVHGNAANAGADTNTTAVIPSVEVVEPGVMLQVTAQAPVEAVPGTVLRSQLELTQAPGALGSAFQITFHDTALPGGVVADGMYTPVQLTQGAPAAKSLTPSQVAAAAPMTASQLTQAGFLNNTASLPAGLGNTYTGEYSWQVLSGALAGVQLQPVPAAQYSSHPDPSNVFARQYPLLLAANPPVVTVPDVFRIISVQSVVASAVPGALPSTATAGQAVLTTLQLAVPLGAVTPLSVRLPAGVAAAALGNATIDAVSVAAVGFADELLGDAAGAVQLSGSNCPGTTPAALQGTTVPITPAGISNSALQLDLCSWLAQSAIDPATGLAAEPLRNAKYLRVQVQLRTPIEAASSDAADNGTAAALFAGTVALQSAALQNATATPNTLGFVGTKIVADRQPDTSLQLAAPELAVPQLLRLSPAGPVDAGDEIVLNTVFRHNPNASLAASPAFDILLRDPALANSDALVLAAVTVNGVTQALPVGGDGADILRLPVLVPGETANVTWVLRVLPTAEAASAAAPAPVATWTSHPTSAGASVFSAVVIGGQPVSIAPVDVSFPPVLRDPSTPPSVPGAGNGTADNGAASNSTAGGDGGAGSTRGSTRPDSLPLGGGQEVCLDVPLGIPEGAFPGVSVQVNASGVLVVTNVTLLLPASVFAEASCASARQVAGLQTVEVLSIAAPARVTAVNAAICALQNNNRNNVMSEVAVLSVCGVPGANETGLQFTTGVTGAGTVGAGGTGAGTGRNDDGVSPVTPTIGVLPLLPLALTGRIDTPAVATGQEYSIDIVAQPAEATRAFAPAQDVTVTLVIPAGSAVYASGASVAVQKSAAGGAAKLSTVATVVFRDQTVADLAVIPGLTSEVGSVVAALAESNSIARALQAAGVGDTFDVVAVNIGQLTQAQRGNTSVAFVIPPGTPPDTAVRHALVLSWSSVARASAVAAVAPTVLTTAAQVAASVACDAAHSCSGNGQCAPVAPGDTVPGPVCMCGEGWMGPSCCACDAGAGPADVCHGNGQCSASGQCICSAGYNVNNTASLDPFCRLRSCNDAPELCAVVRGSPFVMPVVPTCAVACEVGPWSNATAERGASGAPTGQQFITRNVTVLPAYGGEYCPALRNTSHCQLPECLARPAAAAPREACDASGTGFRIAAVLPLDTSSQQVAATVGLAVLLAVTCLVLLLWAARSGWAARLAPAPWHLPRNSVITRWARRWQRGTAVGATEVTHLPNGDALESESLEVQGGDLLPQQRPPLPGKAWYLSQQLWWNWRNGVLLALLATDAFMLPAPLFLERVPWWWGVPVKHVARLLSLTAVTHIPTYAVFYVMCAVGVLLLAIVLPMQYSSRQEALRGLRFMAAKSGSVQPAAAGHSDSDSQEEVEEPKISEPRKAAPLEGEGPGFGSSVGTSPSHSSGTGMGPALSCGSSESGPGEGKAVPVRLFSGEESPKRNQTTLVSLRPRAMSDVPAAGTPRNGASHGSTPVAGANSTDPVPMVPSVSARTSSLNKVGPLPQISQSRSNSTAPLRRDTSSGSDAVLVRGALVVPQRKGHISSEHPAERHHFVEKQTFASGTWLLKTQYLLSTVLVVPVLVILMQPFSCGFPFGGFAEDSLGQCRQSACWDNLHILLAVLSAILLVLYTHAVLVWFPLRLHLDRTLETARDLRALLGHEMTAHILQHGNGNMEVQDTALQRLRALYLRAKAARGVAHDMELVALRAAALRWRSRLEAQPAAWFIAALFCLKLSVVWSAVVLVRQSVTAALVIGTASIAGAAGYLLWKQHQSFQMPRLWWPAQLAYGAAAVVALTLLLLHLAGPEPDRVPTQGGDFDGLNAENSDAYAQSNGFVITAGAVWLLGSIAAWYGSMLRDRKLHMAVPLFRDTTRVPASAALKSAPDALPQVVVSVSDERGLSLLHRQGKVQTRTLRSSQSSSNATSSSGNSSGNDSSGCSSSGSESSGSSRTDSYSEEGHEKLKTAGAVQSQTLFAAWSMDDDASTASSTSSDEGGGSAAGSSHSGSRVSVDAFGFGGSTSDSVTDSDEDTRLSVGVSVASDSTEGAAGAVLATETLQRVRSVQAQDTVTQLTQDVLARTDTVHSADSSDDDTGTSALARGEPVLGVGPHSKGVQRGASGNATGSEAGEAKHTMTHVTRRQLVHPAEHTSTAQRAQQEAAPALVPRDSHSQLVVQVRASHSHGQHTQLSSATAGTKSLTMAGVLQQGAAAHSDAATAHWAQSSLQSSSSSQHGTVHRTVNHTVTVSASQGAKQTAASPRRQGKWRQASVRADSPPPSCASSTVTRTVPAQDGRSAGTANTKTGQYIAPRRMGKWVQLSVQDSSSSDEEGAEDEVAMAVATAAAGAQSSCSGNETPDVVISSRKTTGPSSSEHVTRTVATTASLPRQALPSPPASRWQQSDQRV